MDVRSWVLVDGSVAMRTLLLLGASFMLGAMSTCSRYSGLSQGSVGSTVKIPLSSAVPESALTFCFIPSGRFRMGSPSTEDGHSDDEKQVEVTLSQPFWLAKTEVTQAQWQAVMGSEPSALEGENYPVEKVNWEDVRTFIAKLNEKRMLPDAWKFALPTEAQWEYACRAGEKGPYSGGSLEQVGWFNRNSGDETHEVGLKKPNAWGLHDMHGNVWEWCTDWYHPILKGGTDPVGQVRTGFRVRRGGSWDGFAPWCRAASRSRFDPYYRVGGMGFRPALVPAR